MSRRFLSSTSRSLSRAFMETDAEIRVSQTLTPLLRSPAQKIDFNAQGLEILPVNPRIVYRSKMRNARRIFQKESQEIRDALVLKTAAEKAAAIEERRLFDEDVLKRRQERTLMSADITFDADVIRGADQDPIVAQRAAQWAQWEVEVKAEKAKNYAESMQNASERRMEHLVYLFQASKSFVTLKNMDAMIDDAFEKKVVFNRNVTQDLAKELKEREAVKTQARMDALSSVMSMRG